MARERMVTRTIESAKVEVMAVDTVTADVRVLELICEPQKDNEKYLKMLRKIHETDTMKLVAVNKVELETQLYGMSEVEFLEHARKLPPR